jgi:hypothetical protein
MQAEDLILNESGQWKIVKKICEVFPDICIAILAQALVVKAVNLGNLARFVVTTEDGYAGRVSNFEGNEEGDSLDGEISTINVVA